MPAQHHIDDDNRLIITTWYGEANVDELIDAYKDYQQNIKSQPIYYSYNEIVDFSQSVNLKLSFDEIRKVGDIASEFDREDIKTKLAIIVSPGWTYEYGLALLYESYRKIIPYGNKEIRIFKNESDALDWVKK
jgi:hypothetical protein